MQLYFRNFHSPLNSSPTNEMTDDEEESESHIFPLFSTNVLLNGALDLPWGSRIISHTRVNRSNDMLFVDDVWPGV